MVVQAGLPVFVFAALCVVSIDQVLALQMRALVSEEVAPAIRAISDLGVGTGYIAAAAFYLAGSALCRHLHLVNFYKAALAAKLQRFCLLALASFAASGAVVNLAKFLVGRHRPRDLFDQSQYGFEPLTLRHALDSFPSGHSQTIFVVATVLALAMPRRWRSFGLAAALVAATRIVMTNHYLSDVVVGSWIGIAAVLLIAPHILKPGDAPGLRF